MVSTFFKRFAKENFVHAVFLAIVSKCSGFFFIIENRENFPGDSGNIAYLTQDTVISRPGLIPVRRQQAVCTIGTSIAMASNTVLGVPSVKEVEGKNIHCGINIHGIFAKAEEKDLLNEHHFFDCFPPHLRDPVHPQPVRNTYRDVLESLFAQLLMLPECLFHNATCQQSQQFYSSQEC